MEGVNKAILVGNLGRDPETRTLEGGTKVSRFPMATTESYKNRDGEKVSKTEWHFVVVWRGLAEVVERYLKKGNQVYVEGRIQTRKWQDKDGNDRYTTEVVANQLTMLGGAPKADAQQEQEPAQSEAANVQEPPMNEKEEDDLPF